MTEDAREQVKGRKMNQKIKTLSAVAVAVAALSPVGAQANGFGVATIQPPLIVQEPTTQRAFPGIFGAASAIPGPGGTGFVALNYVNPRGGISGSDADGDIQLGYTLGNPVGGVSATAMVNILGLDPFGDSGNFSFNVAHALRFGGNSATFVGAAVGNAFGWGTADDNDTSYSIQASHLVAFATGNGEVPVQFTVGYGNETTLSDDGLGDVGEGIFYGVGVGVTQTLSASISGTESQLNAGIALTIPQVPGLGLSAGVLDIGDNTDRQQFSFGVAFAF